MNLTENGINYASKSISRNIFFTLYIHKMLKRTQAIRDKETWVVTLDLPLIIN